MEDFAFQDSHMYLDMLLYLVDFNMKTGDLVVPSSDVIITTIIMHCLCP